MSGAWTIRKIQEKLANTMSLARNALRVYVQPRPNGGVPTVPKYDHYAFWAWSYPYDRDGEFYVGWGFSPGENANFFPGLNLPRWLQAFVIVSGDRTL